MWNLLKEHVSRYTPDVVENICGTPKADFLKVCEVLASTSAPDRTTTFLYALGWTQHTVECAEHPYYGDDPVAAR